MLAKSLRLLFFGDVVGAIGRQALVQILPELKKKYKPDLTIANAENLAHGVGITEKTLQELLTAGVDIFTGGNHSWSNPLGLPLFDDPVWKERLTVPMNYGEAKTGRAWLLREVKGVKILILNIMGQLFTHPATTSPFSALDTLLSKTRSYQLKANSLVLVDFHAEATAEKEAFGHYADGKVSAVLGTHTHVATADAKILPGGTAYVTDVGRCGAYDSVIGYEKNSAIEAFLSGLAGKYGLAKKGQAEVNGISIEVDSKTGKTLTLDRIREIVAV